MFDFSPTTLSVLKQNGWTKDRCVDTVKYQRFFEDNAQPISDTILEFLKYFGGFEIRMTLSKYPGETFSYWCLFDVEKSADWIFKENLQEYAKNWIKSPICTVGVNRNDEVVLMTPEGAMFGAMGTWVYKYGNTWEDSIAKICTQGPRERILESK